jgi:predicted AAA+ superfamily ATPase
MFNRQLKLPLKESILLFGARGTGKSTLVKESFPHAQIIDLLDGDQYARLQTRPALLSGEIAESLNARRPIIIDEVQRVPELLNQIHLHIERDQGHFILTGSSARKLRRGGANLLAGRASVLRLFPLLAAELGNQFKLAEALRWGTLPRLSHLDDDAQRLRFLKSYAETYLQEEIIAEQIVRKLPPFRRFLQIAGQMNTKLINYSKIAADVLADPVIVKSYFQVLEDTLLGLTLEPYHGSIRKRQRAAPKFYIFDCGVARTLAGTIDIPVTPSTSDYGYTFEAFLIGQINTALTYRQKQFQLSYLLTREGAEVDLIVERAGEPTILIEIKSGAIVRDEDLGSIHRLSKDFANARTVCLYDGTVRRRFEKTSILPWREGIAEFGLD